MVRRQQVNAKWVKAQVTRQACQQQPNRPGRKAHRPEKAATVPKSLCLTFFTHQPAHMSAAGCTGMAGVASKPHRSAAAAPGLSLAHETKVHDRPLKQHCPPAVAAILPGPHSPS